LFSLGGLAVPPAPRALLERRRRDESRRGTHECVRHEK
jgi:hypothetical protein